MTGRCIIITAHMEGSVGEKIKPEKDDIFLCADGGYLYAREEGIIPAAIIGDFDSIGDPPGAVAGGATEILRLPREKDDTDTMACVRWGLARGYADFIILGGLGGRFDHSYANIQALSYIVDSGCKARIIDGSNGLFMIAGGTEKAAITLSPIAGYKFSLFAFDARCEGVSVTGAMYSLDQAALTQSFPLGVSNEFIPGEDVHIAVKKGKLLIIISMDDDKTA